jgi:hypothetical protein
MSETQTPTEAGAGESQTPSWPLFYQRPEALSATVHASWRIKPGGVGFAAQSNWVPLVASEFVDAGHSYPVLFIGKEHVPVALLGLSEKNRFVRGEEWQSDAYLPAYVRRYPFVFMPARDGFVLAVDADAPNVVKSGDEGQPLFVDGKASPAAEQALKFCETFTREYAATQAFVKLLEEHNLLVERSFNIDLPGRRQVLTGFSLIDPAVFTALPDALIGDWHRRGLLALIYAHLGSLARLPTLLAPVAA